MSNPALVFNYVAVDAAGKRVKGRLEAASESRAFSVLKAQGLAPVRISQGRAADKTATSRLPAADLEALLRDLAALLRAGADIRSSLSIIGRRSPKGALKAACERLSRDIGGGDACDQAFHRLLDRSFEVVPALIAAGEAGGDLAAGLERSSQVLASRRAIRDQLISALSYPLFVLVSAIGAVGLILFGVIPSLEPIIDGDAAQSAPLLADLLAISKGLQQNATALTAVILGSGLLIFVLHRLGALRRPTQRLLLDGPLRGICRPLLFGAFAQSLGSMLSAGAPMSDALRLAVRTAPWDEVRDRLAPVMGAVRQGESLSVALETVRGFPNAMARLAAVGEETGALGAMLARSGAFEEAAALRRIDQLAKLLGPLMIVLLGGLVGGMMAAMLSGVTSLGDAALK